MYDDYDLDYTYNIEYSYDLDEMYDYHMQRIQVRDTMQYESYDCDDDYARDSCDYDALAYKHYAWYNHQIIHEILMYTQAHKRLVRVTLDIECYDDLDLQNINWSDILALEGDENVDISIKDLSDNF